MFFQKDREGIFDTGQKFVRLGIWIIVLNIVNVSYGRSRNTLAFRG